MRQALSDLFNWQWIVQSLAWAALGSITMRAWLWWRSGKGQKLSRKRETTFWILAPLTILVLLLALSATLRQRTEPNRPKFEAQMTGFSISQIDATKTLLMVTGRVKNVGTAPSFAERYLAIATLANGVVSVGELYTVPEQYVFTYPDGTVETISYDQQLDVRTQDPIPPGGQAYGRLFFLFNLDYDTVKHQLAEVRLNFGDAYGGAFTATAKPSGWGSELRSVPGIRPSIRFGGSPSPSPSKPR